MTIKLFGMLKELAGGAVEVVWQNGEDGQSVKDLTRTLSEKFPELGELIQDKKVVISVNHEIAGEDMTVRPGDEVALLPPFAGGTSGVSVTD